MTLLDVPPDVSPRVSTPPLDLPSESAPAVALRPLVASFLTSASAALLVGGIFDSWACRALGIFGALAGTAAVVVSLRSRRQTFAQALTLPVLALVATLTLVGAPGGPGHVSSLVRSAFDAGRLLHPPIPFDPGWRPVVFAIVAAVAFAAGWLAADDRPLIGVLVPLPLVLLASFTQPANQQLLAAVCIFLPLLAALGVLFSEPGSDLAYELRRAVKAGLLAIPALGLLLAFNSASFLFPTPTYNPNDKPQKPHAIPLSSEVNRVLFTVQAPPGFTGPWRTGVLDIYDQGTFKLPAQSSEHLVALPRGGVVDAANAAKASVHVTIATGDLGNTEVLPTVPTQARILLPSSAPSDVRLDSRTGVMRVTAGRAPSGLAYEIDLPPYPSATVLTAAVPASKTAATADDFTVPSTMPPGVQRILREAPPAGWARLDFVRHQLLDHVTAAGPGSPVPMDAKRVEDMLDGSKTGTPFEIVAAEVLLARWAGFGARIGYGFNQFHVENGRMVVRPDNAAQWLEVDFEGYGYVPLLDKPPRANAALDNPRPPDAGVVAGDQVAVELLLPVALPRPVPLYDVVRARLLQALPLLALLLALRLAAPAIVRGLRRRRRERWAIDRGPRARIGVAYAEFRDAATDLNVGDPFATPIEYLALVVDDRDHRELAWLVSRSMYGDIGRTVSDEDARIAEDLSRSLRRRLRTGQPQQVQILAALSQASLRRPFTDEIPNMTLPSPAAALARRRAAVGARVARARRRRRLRKEYA